MVGESQKATPLKRPAPNPIKLNLFALPSQTTVLFALIVGIILAAVISGAIGPSPLCVTPILLGVVLLPLRAYLAWSEREITRHALHPANESYAPLQAEIATLSTLIGLRKSPCLMITNKPIGIYTFGSFRRRYVGLDTVRAQSLISDLTSPSTVTRARAVLLHEMAHFKNGDIWQMGYSHELLRTVAIFLSWSAAFFIGWIFFLMINVQAYLHADLSQNPYLDPSLRSQLEQLLVLDPVSQAEVAQKASQINLGLVASFVLNSLWPMIIVGVIVWVFYWRKLLRTREFYADARAAQALRETSHVEQALVDYGLGLPLLMPRSTPSPITLPTPAPSLTLAFGGDAWNTLRKTHPRLAERVDCLKAPERVFGSWLNTALVVGILVLLLDVLLVSPFASYYLSSFPMHSTVLSAFVAIAVSLLPSVALGRRLKGDIARIVAVVIALRLGWLALNIGIAAALYLISPTMFAEMLEEIARVWARFAGFSSGQIFENAGLAIVEAGIAQLAFQAVIGLSLIVFLYIDTWLKRRTFTWYAYSRIIAVCWGITGLLAFILGTLVLIPTTALIMDKPETLFNFASLSLIVVAILAAVIGAWVFIQANRRYGHRCPKCNTTAAGDFELGKRCEQCGEVFHPWLIADY